MFSQLLDFLDKDVFLRISNKYRGNRYVKSFTCWNQLAVMMFGQLSACCRFSILPAVFHGISGILPYEVFWMNDNFCYYYYNYYICNN